MNTGIAVLTKCGSILSPYSYSGDNSKCLRDQNGQWDMSGGLTHCDVFLIEVYRLTWNQWKNVECSCAPILSYAPFLLMNKFVSTLQFATSALHRQLKANVLPV